MLPVHILLMIGISKLHSNPAATSAMPMAKRNRAAFSGLVLPCFLIICPANAPSSTVTPNVSELSIHE